MFWGYLLCWLPFLLSVLHCTPHTNVNQGYTLYPITYNAVNSCFSLISSVCMRVRACVCVCSDNRCTLVYEHGKIPSRLCACMYICVKGCLWMWVFTSQTESFMSRCLACRKEKRPQRESLVCFLVTAGWGAPYQAHRLPPGVTLETSWCVLGRHNTSCQCHKRRGKWVPHHIENYPGSLRSSLKMH